MLPILNYHILYDEQLPYPLAKDEAIYAIGVREFRRHTGYLYDNNCQGMLLEDYVRLKSGKFSSPNSIIITFDDGHSSLYTQALPILLEYGFPAVFFVTVKNVGSPNHVNWQQLREIASSGMSIQSHTMTHSFLPDLPPEKIRWELRESKSILESQLGRSVDHLSLPGGRCNSIVKNIAIEVGYRAICTSIVGYNSEDTDLYALKRWTVRRNMKFSTFSSIVHKRHSALAYYKARYFLLDGLKKMLGNRLYSTVHREFGN